MKVLAETVRIREYEEFSYACLGEGGADRLEKATRTLGAPVFDFYRRHARARQYVGLVKAGPHTIQILPKVYDGEAENLGYLLALLHYTRKLRIHPSEVAKLGSSMGSFLEVWIRHFALELNRLLRTQYKQQYVEIEERVSFLRGKLLAERELDGSAKLSARYACRYELFTPDHLLNRTLKFCNSLLLRQTGAANNRKILSENDVLMADVASVPVRPEEVDRLQIDRLSRDYGPILDLCRLLLRRSTLDLRAGRISQLAIVFDMAKLFEEFVAEFLKRNASEVTLSEGEHLTSVSVKKGVGRLFGRLRMEPDLILHAAGRTILLDTKYKPLSPGEGPSREDLYQMYAYGTGGDEPFSDIVLLYPSETSAPPNSSLTQGAVRVHVRGFDLRAIYDPAARRLNAPAVREQLNDALSILPSTKVAV